VGQKRLPLACPPLLGRPPQACFVRSISTEAFATRRDVRAGLPDRHPPPYKPRTSISDPRKVMAIERTFSIIKPDATKRNITGKIIDKLESAGLRVVAQKRIRMTREQAEGFYAVHKERPFFGELVEFMSSGPVVVQVLEGENAVAKNREVMGATNPKDAAPGTIRAEYAESLTENSVHGSDGPDTAKQEVAFFFSDDEIVG
jgi:nucleoside-diphosphate kinase